LAGLDGSRAAAEIEADYAQVIRGTLYETASRASPPVSDQLRRAAHLVENDKTQPGIREAFRELASTMEEADQKRIIVAFDNLDHLTSNT
jgi:hypothetical protein